MPSEFTDLALGKAGLLVGCAELLEAMQGALDGDPSGLLARGAELREEIRRAVDGDTLATSPSTTYLGFAHG